MHSGKCYCSIQGFRKKIIGNWTFEANVAFFSFGFLNTDGHVISHCATLVTGLFMVRQGLQLPAPADAGNPLIFFAWLTNHRSPVLKSNKGRRYFSILWRHVNNLFFWDHQHYVCVLLTIESTCWSRLSLLSLGGAVVLLGSTSAEEGGCFLHLLHLNI